MLETFTLVFINLLLPLSILYVVLSWIQFLCFEHPPPTDDNVQRIVLVTGAASGIGREIVRELLSRGDVVVGLDLHPTFDLAAAPVAPSSAKLFTYFQCDVTNADTVKQCAERMKRENIKLDVIVNCAGINRGGPLLEMNPKDMSSVLGVNVLGAANVTRYFYSLLFLENGPKLVYISSEVGWSRTTSAFNVPYSMSKICLESYCVGLRQELSTIGDDLTPFVVVVNPGAMNTPLLAASLRSGFEPKENSQFRAAMMKGGVVAKDYMERHGK